MDRPGARLVRRPAGAPADRVGTSLPGRPTRRLRPRLRRADPAATPRLQDPAPVRSAGGRLAAGTVGVGRLHRATLQPARGHAGFGERPVLQRRSPAAPASGVSRRALRRTPAGRCPRRSRSPACSPGCSPASSPWCTPCCSSSWSSPSDELGRPAWSSPRSGSGPSSSRDLILPVLWVGCLMFLAWSVGALVLAWFTWRRHNWARYLLAASAGAALSARCSRSRSACSTSSPAR